VRMGKVSGLVSVFFVLVVVFSSGFLGASLVLNEPDIQDGFDYLMNGEPEFSGEEIVFSRGQLVNVSNVYRDTETEYGWCLRIDGSRVRQVDHFRFLNYTTESSIRFSCNTLVHNGRMHTHPGDLAKAGLSDQDRETLFNRTEWEVSCVVADPVDVEDESNPDGLACFKDVGGEAERLEVRVTR